MQPDATAAAPQAVAVVDERMGCPSASGFGRLAACPGSWRLWRACPPSPDNAAAQEGTRLHKHMEEGTTPADDAAEEQQLVLLARQMEEELVTELLGSYDACVREQRLWGVTPETPYSCQADAVYISGHAALVIDYKFGRIPAPAAGENWQLAVGSNLVRENIRAVDGCQLDCVYAAIIQPRVSTKPTVAMYEGDVLAGLPEQIAAVIAAAMSADAPLVPSVAACRYCPAQACCPAAARELMTVDMAQLWAVMTPEEKRIAYDRAKLATSVANGIIAAVRADLNDGKAVTGLTLSTGRQKSSVTDVSGAFAMLQDSYGVTDAEFVACCSVGLGNLDELITKKAKERDPKMTKKAAQETGRALLAQYMTVTRDAPSIKEEQ